MIFIEGSFQDFHNPQVGTGGFNFYNLRWPKPLIVNDIVFLIIETRHKTERCAEK